MSVLTERARALAADKHFLNPLSLIFLSFHQKFFFEIRDIFPEKYLEYRALNYLISLRRFLNRTDMNSAVFGFSVAGLLVIQAFHLAPGIQVIGFNPYMLYFCAELMLLNVIISTAMPQFKSIGLICGSYGLYIILINDGLIISYFTTMADLPAVDKLALAIDRWCGFDWPKVMRAIDEYPRAVSVLRFAYKTIWLQGFVVLAVLSILNQTERMKRFFIALAICFFFTLLLSALLPLESLLTVFPPTKFNNLTLSDAVNPMHSILALRAGTRKLIDLQHPEGLISFPSFHVIMSILWPYAAWRLKPLLAVIIPVNVGLFLSALTEGGHYLVDVLGGLAVAAISIGLTHLICSMHLKNSVSPPSEVLDTPCGRNPLLVG